MVAIIISSVLLAMEGPQGSLRSLERTDADKEGTNELEDLLSVIDTCFYGVFLFEFFTKLIAFGFWNTPNAYIKDPWNKLDFGNLWACTWWSCSAEPNLLPLWPQMRCFRRGTACFLLVNSAPLMSCCARGRDWCFRSVK